jgi:hypothetical protein
MHCSTQVLAKRIWVEVAAHGPRLAFGDCEVRSTGKTNGKNLKIALAEDGTGKTRNFSR